MREIRISDEAYEELENTAALNHCTVDKFIEFTAQQWAMPRGQQGLMAYRQVLRKVPDALANFSKNFPKIRACKSVSVIKEVELASQASKAALVIANGPSLTDEQLQLIGASGFRQRGGLTLCVDSALRRCLRAGLIPDFVVCLDTAIYAKAFFEDPVVDKFNKRLNFIVPVDLHPEILDMLKGELYFFKTAWPPYPSINLMLYMNYMFPEIPTYDSGGNVGSFSMYLAYNLMKDWVAAVGLDLSWPGTTLPWETENYFLDVLDHGGNLVYDDQGNIIRVVWPCGTKRCPDAECNADRVARGVTTEDWRGVCPKTLESQYVHVTDPFGNDRIIDVVYDIYVDSLALGIKNLKELRPSARFFNCSQAGLAYPEGMERMSLEEWFKLLGVL